MRSFLLLSAIVVIVTVSVNAADGVSFITLGDWGGAALEEPTKPVLPHILYIYRLER